MTRSLALAVACVLVLLAGCANPYSQFYTNQLGGRSVHEIPQLIAHDGTPQIHSTNDHERDGRALMENGYFLIGYSDFNAGSVGSRQAIHQAKKVGAAIVLISSRYTNSLG